ncbi:MAG TPA: oxidoreductase [Candidatus Latescibacteria bacterium]|nr:oxidoreductase [Gemmatimonadaceae bacterium]MDP6015091.1 oxidoreductase [Candidatus Latescibacterota bacterium]HJP29917.1 oxidoreductase [Candidatus Latescibacterota bacterium]
MAEAESVRRKVREIETVVAEVREQTHDTASLFLDLGEEPRDYRAGQFITIDPHQFAFLEQTIAYLEEIKGGREKPRAYSMGSAPHERHILVTIKEERFWPGESKYPPVLSPSLTRNCAPGTPVVIKGFAGAYTLPADAHDRTDNILHVCAGSGIVPNYALIKHSLHVDDGLRHVLLYSSKTKADIIYYDDFAALARAHPDRLEIVHCLTREDPVDIEPVGRRGRVDAELIARYVPDPSNCLVFSCGPGVLPWERQEAKAKGVEPQPRFIEHMMQLLKDAGLEKSQIKQESWG